ncbi:serine/threonine protein kinase [Nocardioides KLBMP 9356]|uniref:non-specific serine/threonine protein kinase n=1 Tax=Nocardioides potassii TaxID=2911371 RepID=A0ABS9HED8_9ACTN|nr:serine/threonine-protein kinase [Nocardioides potassii]MCF6378471.1 serine/threonine protein kinase [Nocardioides potassii]
MSRRAAAAPPEIPGLRFIEPLGVGGFADVYRYEQLGRTVAVKVLTADLSHNSQQAFEAEANQMARLSNHPSIVSIYHAGAAPDGRSFLVMEVCQPRTLDDRIKVRTYPVPKALEITIQIAGAVESAHRLGVLHRDIKPANILFTEFGRAALTDFGISVSTQDGQQGVGIGVSPAWAPPEQVTRGQPMGPASDVYSLAATCWAMLGGRSPMVVPGGDNSNLALMARARNEPVPPLRREDVPEALERVLRTAMAKSMDQRYPSALELARALQAIQTSLHLPVTPIEVGEDTPDVSSYVDETGVEDAGSTRISTFKVIDPDGPPVSPPAPAPVVPTSRSTGPDFTGPAIPASVTDATVVPQQPDATVTPPAVLAGAGSGEEAEVRSSSRPKVVAGIAAAAVVAALVGWQVLGGDTAGTTQDTEVDSEAPPADAIGSAVPTPQKVRLTRQGKRVEVTWQNPDPEDGDTFLYRVADPSRERPFAGPVDAAPVTVPAQAGRTCVEVVLRRSNGQASEGTTECTR